MRTAQGDFGHTKPVLAAMSEKSDAMQHSQGYHVQIVVSTKSHVKLN